MSVSEEWREKWLEKIKESQKIMYYLLGDTGVQMTFPAATARSSKVNSTFLASISSNVQIAVDNCFLTMVILSMVRHHSLGFDPAP